LLATTAAAFPKELEADAELVRLWEKFLDQAKTNERRCQLEEAAYKAAIAECPPIPDEIAATSPTGDMSARPTAYFEAKRQEMRNDLIGMWSEINGVAIDDVPAAARAEGTSIADDRWNPRIAAARDYHQKRDAALRRHHHEAFENQRTDSFCAMLRTLETIHKTQPQSLLGVQIRLLAVGYYAQEAEGRKPEHFDKLVHDLERVTGRTLPDGIIINTDPREAPAA